MNFIKKIENPKSSILHIKQLILGSTLSLLSTLVLDPFNTMANLVQVKSFDDHRAILKNVVICLFVGKRILTVTERTGKVGFIGGGIKAIDKNIFSALKREYREEIGYELPLLQKITRFVYKDTAIYVAHTTDFVSTKIGPNADDEITAIHLTKIKDIKMALVGNGAFSIRQCARHSTSLLFDILKL